MAASLNLIGCAFDPETGEARLAMKRSYAAMNADGRLPVEAPRDPAAVLKPYALELPETLDGGIIVVEEWALPIPGVGDPHDLTATRSMALLRQGACRAIAGRVRERVKAIPQGLPVMIGIDHSASGGAIEAISDRVGRDNLLVVMLDSHLDAVPGEIRQGLLAYAQEHPDVCGGAGSAHDLVPDPPDYECGSFLHDLMARGVLRPDRLVVLGCADIPAHALQTVSDRRVERYLAHYHALLQRGMRVVPRDVLKAATDPAALVAGVLAAETNRAVYLSIDMDVGAGVALTGARFLDHQGLSRAHMLALVDAVLIEATSRGNRLAGMDLMEFDFYRAGMIVEDRQDPTYDIALQLIHKAAERLNEAEGRTQWDGLLA